MGKTGALLVALAVTVTALPASAAVATRHVAVNTSGCVALIGVPTTATGVVDVRAPSQRSTQAVATLYRRQGACWRKVAGPYHAWIGADGLSAHHREGDLTTPIGIFGFDPVMYGVDANPGVSGPYHRLVCGDWWDEDPNSAQYNAFVHVPCGSVPPFARGSEALWREAPAYDAFAVIAYNTTPRIAGRGSGIFVHQSEGGPTAGCVALAPRDLVSVLRFIDRVRHPTIAIRTSA